MGSVLKYVVLSLVLGSIITGSVFAAIEAYHRKEAAKVQAEADAAKADRDAMLKKYESAGKRW